MQSLLHGFVAAADEVGRLQRGKDPECLLAQKVFEQGHYAGRTQPTNTRQGIYAAAPSGVLLASINTNDPKRIAGMLRSALEKWSALSADERRAAEDPAAQSGRIERPEKRYPEDGLVLRVFSRDLPRASEQDQGSGDGDGQRRDWRTRAWNQDYAWFRREEARALLPAELRVGEKAKVPVALVRRLARLNFVDNVRGQTIPYRVENVETAELVSEVVGVADGVATVRFRGTTLALREGVWAIEGFKDLREPAPHAIRMELVLHGTAAFDTAKGEFVAFDVLALGTRAGATQYNGRHDDQEPAPIGFHVGLAGDAPAERVAPAFYWEYGWR